LNAVLLKALIAVIDNKLPIVTDILGACDLYHAVFIINKA
ncbi:hypothetical protein VII00023_06974, partial [Vibrio ichthyoenteri ATCC 700023]